MPGSLYYRSHSAAGDARGGYEKIAGSLPFLIWGSRPIQGGQYKTSIVLSPDLAGPEDPAAPSQDQDPGEKTP